ncbi:maleylpyruvate isomerase family mycothiol-dependent enzyme [Streptomyces sp. NPDC090052]|uniref:maleylpyruvate isomerase family mycothiol-dependent enzyme n=1 Tax=unclassified Streptomyces TaxID=2593676 RepID=UPI002E24F761|nr:maleylpyruvate isomerase family mycothiol-dependent enzyme [Streptomyces sp. NBC_01020]WSX46154.1 maleylpyruvate isomerase family mycothiol-dependent enzyme [Streptomyces sp. NBC_00963]WSX65772.1 maleylpyruvate isomerase family mycothiol-dependent enzyme [Streptomyces sp. NBC_00932]
MSEERRDPALPGRLLLTERDALMPLLRSAPEELFAFRTACPGWTVREVVAHCAAALVRIVEGRLEEGVFSPGSNAADVAERACWPLRRVLDELERGLSEAGPVIALHEDGLLDTVAFGEWVHAGDVRDAWGAAGAYAVAGEASELVLLSVASRKRGTPLVHAVLDDGNRTMALGNKIDGRPPARLVADVPTLIRLYSGRPLVGTQYELEGADERELVIYR